MLDLIINRVVNLTEEKIPFAKLDKISYEIGKSLLGIPKDGFELVERLWQEVKGRKVESNSDVLKVSSITVVLSNILGMLSGKHFGRVVNLIVKINLEGSNWYITDNLATRAVKGCYRTSPDKIAEKVAVWIKSDNKWHRRLGVVSTLVGVKYCNMDVDWGLNILQEIIPQDEPIVNKSIAWMLRDLSKKYPDKVKKFIENYKDSPDRNVKYIVKHGGRKLIW